MKTKPFLLRFFLVVGLLPAQAAQFGDFQYTSSGTAITITKYTGSGGAVTIPDTIQGMPVTSIGDGAFSGCTGLTSIMIPNSVVSIGDNAFSYCAGLTSITIPDSVTSIGDSAFSRCSGLVAITVNALNPAYSSQDGVLFNRSQATVILYPGGKTGSYTIPDSVASIGPHAFLGCTGLTSITIPDSVTSIRYEAFFDCGGLKSVYFYGNAPVEEAGAFDGCPKVTVYYLPGTTGWGPTFGGRRTVLGHGAAVLEIWLHPAIRVTGEVGSTYVIESKAEMGGDVWLTRGWLELTTPTAIWTDPVPTDSPHKVYRAVKVAKPAVETIPNMVWIPPGRFVMGSPETERGRFDREGPETRVELTKGFWLGKCEVTVGEYFAVMGQVENLCLDPQNPGELDRPVERVSWDDAVAYCQRLTEQERAAGRIGANSVYRLPTEAEWEYACRAGTTTRYSFGDALGCSDVCEYCPLLDSYMWWCGNGGRGRVGQKLANPWGLYDMHGNVAEWCQDRFDWPSFGYPGGAVVEPQGPAEGSFRVLRGGIWGGFSFWHGNAGSCRSAYRHSSGPDYGDYGFGFRVLLAPSQP